MASAKEDYLNLGFRLAKIYSKADLGTALSTIKPNWGSRVRKVRLIRFSYAMVWEENEDGQASVM